MNRGLLLLLLAAGCGHFSGEKPIEYSVIKGDTLFVIAADHGVTVDQLREWNDLQGDLIEIDQVLLIYTDRDAAPQVPKTAKRTRKRIATVTVTPTGLDEAPPLMMPDSKDCLKGPQLGEISADEQMIGSSGLGTDAVRGAMNAFVGNTLSCITDTYPQQALLMEITVGCDGRVSNISVVDSGDWSSEMASCVTTVLGYAPFPAHDLPGGEVFQYPLRFTPG